ncbi:MAG: hypothetical protein IKK14_04290 [Oscillospiraceae bacterium]|nr:hypothetical protein [Oscillospiraceae bacterium]
MKKALALVLALVLALSMAVSALALDLVELVPAEKEKSDLVEIPVVKVDEVTLLLYEGGKYYIALEDEAWEDVEVTTNGNVTAKLVEYDPAKMIVTGMDIKFNVTYKGEAYGEPFVTKADRNSVETYKAALKYAEDKNDDEYVTYWDVEVATNVNIIEIVVEDNYSAHYTEGTIKVEAVLDDEDYVGEVEIINDVVNFEYELVKWAAKNFTTYAKTTDECLFIGEDGYSDYRADLKGYDEEDEEYYVPENRVDDGAAVVSTTAFRAIEGKDLRLIYNDILDVVLYDIVKGQKGVNFSAYTEMDYEDLNDNDDRDYNEPVNALEVGFLGNQVVKGDFEITIRTGLDWFELRELFDVKVEEDDIISYYIVDKAGKVVGGKEIDYMTADLTKEATFTVKGNNQALGEYKIVLEVPAAEEGEANPNTGAESVVGVVAALAVVSVATAAAVSLKK